MTEQIVIVEFRRNFEEIRSLLEEGVSLKMIHKKLTEEGKMSVEYHALHKWIRKTKLINYINNKNSEQ